MPTFSNPCDLFVHLFRDHPDSTYLFADVPGVSRGLVSDRNYEEVYSISVEDYIRWQSDPLDGVKDLEVKELVQLFLAPEKKSQLIHRLNPKSFFDLEGQRFECTWALGVLTVHSCPSAQAMQILRRNFGNKDPSARLTFVGKLWPFSIRQLDVDRGKARINYSYVWPEVEPDKK